MIKEKLNILLNAKDQKIFKAVRYFNIPRITINSWKKQEEELSSFKNKNNLTMYKGRQPKFIDVENKLYEFFEFSRTLGTVVTVKFLLLQMIKLIKIMRKPYILE